MNVFSSLTNRIFLASAALVLLAMAVTVYRVNVSVTKQAEADLLAGLDEAASLVDQYSQDEFEKFRRQARFVADLPDLKNAVRTDDPPTVQPIAQEYQRDLSADVFVVLDRSGRVLAQAGGVTPALDALDVILAARPTSADIWFWPYTGGLLEVAAIPMEPGPASIGTLIVGFSLDQAVAERIRAKTHSDIAFASGSTIAASTLPADRVAALAPVAEHAGVVEHVSLGTDDYIASIHSLGTDRLDVHAPVAIVLRSRTERLRFLGALQRDIAVTGFVAVLLATVVGYLVARTVTRPLRALSATMGEMAATGDLARTVPEGGVWDDEDARLLASTFRRLATALDRFRREAAQRERLSSLGRFSAVVAHEVRNPLMIIKSAVRTLRREPPAETVQSAAASIEEEVGRLNHLVTDVLDFAKPIPFELAPADLIEICRAAAHAVQSSGEHVPIALETTRPSALIVTDAERVRAVLVNLLTNAQAAVRARYADAAGRPAVVLSVSASVGQRWRIDVSDRGAGIAAADLPRIFEPFFTTRRTGSGLGLAISRNIIEGLGGTIRVESVLNAGTTVHLDLPGAGTHA